MERPSRNTMIRYFRGQCRPHEVRLVKLYLAMDVDQEFVETCLKEAWLTDPGDDEAVDDDDVKAFSERFYARQRTMTQLPRPDRQDASPRFRFPAWMKAAAAVVLIGSAALLIYNTQWKPAGKPVVQQENDMLPGTDKALLTLADGATISLSEVANGEIVEQAGIRVEKTAAGEIVYRADNKTASPANAYNSVVTPNGGQYGVTLPDGSKAWLNAASSLTYPIHFQDDERRVKMTGEIFFEIAKVKDPGGQGNIPFFVETDKQEIQVLGTRFNVNAYSDEPYTSTALVEGSVRVTANGKSVMLKPGQQANLSDDLKIIAADMEQQLAWKNGDFVFKQEPLSGVLRKISRWYDLEVDCPEELGKIQFTGMISRNQPLSAVVKSIASLGTVAITLKERRIVVKQ